MLRRVFFFSNQRPVCVFLWALWKLQLYLYVTTAAIPVVSVKDKKLVKNASEGESVVLQCNIPNSKLNTIIHWMDMSKSFCFF